MKKILPGIIFLVLIFVIIGVAVYFSEEKDGLEEEIKELIAAQEDGKQDFIEEKKENGEAEKLEEQKYDDKGKKEEESVEEIAETNWQWVNRQNKLYSLTPTEVNLVLIELKQRFPDKAERLKAISILRLGTPYQLGCLGEEAGRDKNPIFRIDVADYTVFVLTNVALLHFQTTAEAREMMKFLNYRSDSEISFENRLHFSTDRNSASPYFKDITEEIAGLKTQKKTVILNKKRADGTRLIDIDREREIILKYIASQHITGDFLDSLPEVTGVAFIREGDEEIGLDIRHEGFLFGGKTLIHASPAQGGVVEENFLGYYFTEQKNPRFDGIILFGIN